MINYNPKQFSCVPFVAANYCITIDDHEWHSFVFFPRYVLLRGKVEIHHFQSVQISRSLLFCSKEVLGILRL